MSDPRQYSVTLLNSTVNYYFGFFNFWGKIWRIDNTFRMMLVYLIVENALLPVLKEYFTLGAY